MIKKILAFLLICAMCLALFGCNNSSIGIIGGADGPTDIIVEEKDKTEDISPLLYKVTDDDGNVAWLFGSIHVGSEDFYPLPEYVMDAYDSADVLAVEIDTLKLQRDENAQKEYFYGPMKYKDGSTIKDHISTDLYDNAVEILTEYGKYKKENDGYIPAMWSSAIDQCMYEKLSYDMNKGIDNYFMNLSEKEGKEIVEVEKVDAHFATLYELSEDVQLMMLENSVYQYNNADYVKESFDSLVNAWKNGNKESLQHMLCAQPFFETEEQERIYQEYREALTVERDKIMTDYVMSNIEDFEMFVCVGTAHVVGENGIVDRLKNQGYSVEKVE